MTEDHLFCTFHLGEHLFGIEIDQVQEVIRSQEITRVPLAAPAVRGVINLRGRIIPAVDLRRCLEMESLPTDRVPANIVVRGAGSTSASLLVDEIGDVVETTSAAYEETPPTLGGRARDLVECVYKLQDAILLVLAIGKVLRAAYAESSLPHGRS
ncbi:MAG TPA: chemotaxis protein CheW [Candidatus Eisenbacteria bacterium]|nr:chemotaxis protein CheW [Candidatus Eisenbacteria bacterium]